MQKAQELGKGRVKFYGSAMTAPLWMKTRQVWEGFSLLKKEYYQTWADYIVKFLDSYKEHNITFWGLTTGHQPSGGYKNVPDPQIGPMGFNPDDQVRTIVSYKYLQDFNCII